jgi:hypothetical protein
MMLTDLNKRPHIVCLPRCTWAADQDADSGRYFVGMRLLSLATAAKRVSGWPAG